MRLRAGSALAAAVFALAAGAAAARGAEPQTVHITGYVAVGFGRLEREGPPERTQGEGFGEAVVNFAAGQGPLRAQVELGVTEDPNLDYQEHQVQWRPGAVLTITASGSSFDIPATEGVTNIVNAPQGPLGDREVDVNYEDIGLLDATARIGGVAVGLAVVDACRPACGLALDAGGAPVNAQQEQNSAVVHLAAGSDALAFNGYLGASRGTFGGSALRERGEGRVGGLGLVLGGGGWRAAAELSRSVIRCNPGAGAAPCSDDNEVNRYGAALEVGGFAARYFLEEDETGAARSELTNVDVVYTWTLEAGRVGPELRAEEREAADGTVRRDTFLLLGLSVEF